MEIRQYIHGKVIIPVTKLLRQGITPEKIAMSIAWGVVIGIFPGVGTTTLLCTIVAVVLRLNLPIIQLANWLVYPLQIALLLPFFFIGACVFGSGPLTHDAQELIVLFQSDLMNALVLLWDVLLQAIIVWLVMSPFMILGIFVILRPVLRRLLIRTESVQSRNS